MVTTNLRALFGIFVLCGALADAPDADAAMSADEWMDTIRAPLRNDGEHATARACPGVGMIGFELGRSELSVEGSQNLESLAEALASPDLGESSFQVLWLANRNEAGHLAQQRVARIESLLRSRPTLPTERLRIEPAASALEDCSRSAPADAMLLQVRTSGRWWGGQ